MCALLEVCAGGIEKMCPASKIKCAVKWRCGASVLCCMSLCVCASWEVDAVFLGDC